MTAATLPATSPLTRYAVSRWTVTSRVSTAGVAGLMVAMIFVPAALGADVTQNMTSLLILVMLAVMWNALAGFGGMVSVGQQAFIGLGAYGTIYLTHHGVSAYLAMVVAALGAGAVALVESFLVLRLRGGQFAIGTWVVAEVFALVVALDADLGAGTGTSLTGLRDYDLDARISYTYWLTLGFAALLIAALFLLLRTRLGASLQAIRDDEEAAASVGVRVVRAKRVLFVLAAFGCGAAGAMTLANTLFIQPASIFGVQWSAYMIFMVLVGGLGTFEGPIIGAIVFYAIQNQFADSGAWYLVGLGATAIAFALFIPRGLWGSVEQRFQLRLLPVGHRIRALRGGARTSSEAS